MMVALGNKSWINPTLRKLNNILSTTRSTVPCLSVGTFCRIAVETCRAYLLTCEATAPTSPVATVVTTESLIWGNIPLNTESSPIPNTRPELWLARIDSTSVDPDRIMPTTKIGVLSLEPTPAGQNPGENTCLYMLVC